MYCAKHNVETIECVQCIIDAQAARIKELETLTMKERKPCPVCGGKADESRVYDTNCTTTGCMLYGVNFAIERWNEWRPGDDTVADQGPLTPDDVMEICQRNIKGTPNDG